jgi:alkylation response protein AidB-like acyl-CoA dehydrogenase
MPYWARCWFSYRLDDSNGDKLFTTTGGEAHFYTLYTKTDKRKRHKGISSFIVGKDFPGLSYEKKRRRWDIAALPPARLSLITAGYLLEICLEVRVAASS